MDEDPIVPSSGRRLSTYKATPERQAEFAKMGDELIVTLVPVKRTGSRPAKGDPKAANSRFDCRSAAGEPPITAAWCVTRGQFCRECG